MDKFMPLAGLTSSVLNLSWTGRVATLSRRVNPQSPRLTPSIFKTKTEERLRDTMMCPALIRKSIPYWYYTAHYTMRDIADLYGYSLGTMRRWFREIGIVVRDQVAENNPRWRGDAAGYTACHDHVRRVRGTPSVCAMCDTTTAKCYNWANLTRNYRDVNDYIRLCRSCHSRMDGIGSWLPDVQPIEVIEKTKKTKLANYLQQTQCKHGHPYPESRRKGKKQHYCTVCQSLARKEWRHKVKQGGLS